MEDLLSPTEASAALGITPGALARLNLPRVMIAGRACYREDVIQARAQRIAERAVNGLVRRLIPGGPVRDVDWSRYLAAERAVLAMRGKCACGGPAVKRCPTCKRARALKRRLAALRGAA